MARLANVFFCAAVTACLSILLTHATDHATQEMCAKRLAHGKRLGRRCIQYRLNDQPADEEVVVCPRKSHLIGSRVCKKACTQNSDCKGSKKKCVCDDVCGLTCLNPTFNTCERLRAPKYGSRLGKKLTVGSVMSFVCDTGYKLSGTAKRICQQDGTWSGSQPDCSPVDCGDPGHLWNGYIEGKKFTYSSVIKYMCFDGTKFDGLAMMATCEATGQWSFPLPRCMGSCTRPEILHAQLLLEEGRAAPISMDHGTSLTVQCSAGLVVSEPATPVCNNGTWSSLPICVQGGCDHRPKEISNGMALYRGTKYGDRVRYNCNAGYKLVGDTFLTCRNGRWEGTVPECKAVYCPHPGELTNGKVLLVGNIGKFEYRPYIRLPGQSEKIVYYCSTGYRLEGPSAATCINGMWSPDTRPKCVDNQHPMLPKTQELFTT
ncbi:hypothetical protein EB796_004007 [Bugula neritina]|uniref:SVEP1 n=1 Tax=Bugula neritina TaxID=10212 RepID=A0A7J7KJA9_BUGNE|nr:hypothetical protein EB796_004007 [Bugula neritina]